MSALSIYTESGSLQTTLTQFTCIASTLKELGILFERWHLVDGLSDDAEVENILDAYRGSIELLTERFKLHTADVVQISSEHPDSLQLQKQCLHEHTHEDFGVRFFIKGSGLLYFHIDQKVYLLMCEPGDLICMPEKVYHWFDIGETPELKCIHLCMSDQGCQSQVTGSRIAEKFPSYDEYMQLIKA